MSDPERRLARATARVIRPASAEARDLNAADDAFWDAVPLNDRLALAFHSACSSGVCMGGAPTDLAQDFRDLLRAFVDHDVRFLVVGAYALAAAEREQYEAYVEAIDLVSVLQEKARRILVEASAA